MGFKRLQNKKGVALLISLLMITVILILSTIFTFRAINEERKLLEKKNLKLEDLRINNEEKVKFYKEEANKAYKAYKWSETKSFWKSTAFFVLGVAATGLASYAAIRSTR